MIITKIHIKSFGAFDDYTFIPCAGLNVIYAPNESGKTTLLDFVRYMLYGASQRKKHDGITFKEKYMPWNGYEISGSIEFFAGGKNYLLTRSDGMKSSEKSCRIFNLATGEELPVSAEPGREFLHLSESAFFDSCFISDVRSISADKSNGELMTLVSGLGIDEASYARVRKSLSDAYTKLSSSKRAGSELNMINSAIRECEGKITSLEGKCMEYQKLLEREKGVTEALGQLKTRRAALVSESNSERMNSLIRQKNHEQRHLELLRSRQSCICGTKALIADESEKEIMQYVPPKMRTALYRALTAASAFLAVLAFCTAVLWPEAVWVIPFLVILAGLSAFFAFRYHVCQKNADNMLKKQRAVFDKFSVNSYNEYVDACAKNSSDSGEADELRTQIEFSEKRIAYIDGEISVLGTSVNSSFSGSEKFVETNIFTNEDINDIINKIDTDISRLRIRQDKSNHISRQLEDTVSELGSVHEEYKLLQKKKASLESQIKVYECAIGILDAAFDEMNSNVAPVLIKKAYDVFSSVADSRYESIAANENFSSSVFVNGTFRSSAHLSAGTRDMLDFSLRLAVVSMISDSDSPLPLFMDEPFSSADDERVKKLLDIVLGNSHKHQTFFVTCRGREGMYYTDNSQVNTVSI